MSDKKVITRFAPSPTGFIHVGNVRTALYAWLWARKNNGTFILRIEDTDKKREVAGSIEHIKQTLKWLGLDWDEGPNMGESFPRLFNFFFRKHSPYIQSERLEKLNIYKKYAEKLIARGFAYADESSEEEVQKMREQAEAEKRAFLFREYRPENPPEWKLGLPLRFKIKELKRTTWYDIVRGELTAGPEALDDFILIKRDGFPTYNFAHIVDDIEMGVTHVVRGQEFISSTPNYIAVYEALEVKEPVYVTAPPILGVEGTKKMGKRDGAKDTLEYKREGYLPEAMFNFLVFLGWNPGGEKEIMTRKEIISLFDITKIQKSGAQFNEEKLIWMNKEHLKTLKDTEFIKRAKPYINLKIKELKNFETELEFDNFILKFRDRIEIFSQLNKLMLDDITNASSDSDNKIKEMSLGGAEAITKTSKNKETTHSSENQTVLGPNDYLLPLKDPIIDDSTLIIPKDLDSKTTTLYLSKVKDLIEKVDWKRIVDKNDADKENLWTYAGQEGRGKVLWPLRVALSGQIKSPDPFEIMKSIKKEATLRRIENAIKRLETPGKELKAGTQTKTKSHFKNLGQTFTSSN
jgi:glutamyl-tRNA synthetase